MLNWKPIGWMTLVVQLCLCSCLKEETKMESFFKIPSGFTKPLFPADNEYSESRFLLGRKLFYDPILSIDSTISCATCHKPEFAFTDRKKVSEGVFGRLGNRNAPSLANIAYHPYLLREGGVPTLEMQIGVPIQEHNEFDHNILLIADKLNQQSEYRELSLIAYGRLPDAFVITRSIATFERSLLCGDTPYDKFINGNSKALSPSALNGWKLFNSPDLKCNQCHGDFNFTNYAFANNGLYEDDPDEGRMRLTGKTEDRSLYKIPSLRNVEITFPYMHDGSINTLEEIVAHYASGGKNNPHKSALISGFKITELQKMELVTFLKSLTDSYFINNPDYRIQ
ncbi:MAG: cytochrome-c peroxidase [Bacteroidota bacterium]|nr:cytochrome-c peroxidase [Bacteroidota bacterium]